MKEYKQLGFKLVALKGKSPVKKNWNKSQKSDKKAGRDGFGVGVKLSFSGLCCFDIDDLTIFRQIVGKAWKLIREGYWYRSGKPNRAKILFRTEGVAYPTLPLGKGCGQFRCSDQNSNTMQDVLPPSLHPEGYLYTWLGLGDLGYSRLEEDAIPPMLYIPDDCIPTLPTKLARQILLYKKSERPRVGTKFKAPYVTAYNEWAEKEGRYIDDEISKIDGYTRVLGGFRRNGSSNRLAIKVYSSSDAFNFSTTEEQKIPYGPLDLYNILVIGRYQGKEKEARTWVCNELKSRVDEKYGKSSGREKAKEIQE